MDDDESEVELDSLGSFFVHLIDNDHSQDDAEGATQMVKSNYPFLRLRTSAKTESSSSKPESKVFSSFSLFGSQLYFEEAAT